MRGCCVLAVTCCLLAPRPGRLGGVPHAEDAHGNGDDQVRQHTLLGQAARGGLGHAVPRSRAQARPLAALEPELSCLLGSRYRGLEFGNLSYRASFCSPCWGQ